jgi:hypothetical protein
MMGSGTFEVTLSLSGRNLPPVVGTGRTMKEWYNRSSNIVYDLNTSLCDFLNRLGIDRKIIKKYVNLYQNDEKRSTELHLWKDNDD